MQISRPRDRPDPHLELRINAYMAIFHIHPEIKSPITDEDLVLDITADRLENYKQYLDQNGGDFADDAFVPYFSLPYVLSVDTDKNEDIKLIFEKKWIEDLNNDLEVAIDRMCSCFLTS
jgi:2-oxo-4-hydroxy-4-carboxy--5-ureidoimidazoline (OHCU) decarboxylase